MLRTTRIILSCLLLLCATSWATPEEELLSALTSLDLHITKAKLLSDTEIAAHKSTIDTNKDLFGSSSAIISASFKLVETYDTEIGPLWVSGSPIKEFTRAKVSDSDINWVVYTVMQSIIDKTYTQENIEANKNLFAGFKFGSSVYFPGAVEAPADPEKTYTATISGTFLKTFGHDTMYWANPARKPTGCYLAPGTISTVTVPEALVGKGYQVRVGGHAWDFFRLPTLYRLDRCSVLYDIDSTEINVSNPLGGGIYIEVPYESDAGIVDIQIKNAVPSPYYSAKSFHSTTLAEWQDTQRHHKAPWADFQTEKFMIHVPTDWIYNLEDPAPMLAEWDSSMDATNELMGFPTERGKETLYAQVDLDIPFGFHATGYPALNAWYDPNEDFGGSHDHYLVTTPKNADYYEFHEMGHGYLAPKFEDDTESNVNLLHVAVLNRKLGFSLDEAFMKSRASRNPNLTLDMTAICWMMCANFKNNKPMNWLEMQYQLKGHAKFVEMARLFGWEVLNDFWKDYMVDLVAIEDTFPYKTNNDDAMLLRLSKSAGVDIRPLFQFWGLHPDDPAALQKSIEAENLLPSMDIYRTLKKYQSLIPADKAEFQTFATVWWGGKQPTAKGQMTEQWHAAIWDTYDQAYVTRIDTNVDTIIDQYFPDGPPEVVGVDDTDTPTPNLMTFLTHPTVTGEQSISMTATEAIDSSWTEYYFACTAGGGHDSNWQSSRTYEDTGLTPDTLYSYTVKARDYSPAQNTTAPSLPASAKTKIMDSANPKPAQMTMKIAPKSTSPSTIYMQAATASDSSGIEYYFTCTTGSGHDSGWQEDTSYTDAGLKAETKYTYTVTARDKSPQHNTTKASKKSSATTQVAITEPYLVMSKLEYAAGEEIVIHFGNAGKSGSDWVGIFNPPTTKPASAGDGIQYFYTSDLPGWKRNKKNGSITFNPLAAGTYQARLHFNDDYPIQARIEFTVK